MHRVSLLSAVRVSNETIREEVIEKILNAKTDEGQDLFERFNADYVSNFISLNIPRIEKLFESHKKMHQKGVDIIDFLYFMLKEITHSAKETLFIAIALVDFFQTVSESENVSQFIRLENITNYISDSFSEVPSDSHAIQTKRLADRSHFKVDYSTRNVRDIDLHPPSIFKDGSNLIRRLTKDGTCIDAIRHNHNQIISSTYSSSLNRIITLDSYADHFLLYSAECVLLHTIRPKIPQLQNQVCIDFAWSERHQRLGAYFRDGYLIFWDATDGFVYEKVFKTGSSTNEEQTRIWYLTCIDRWVTTDSNGNLNFWDIETESAWKSIKSQEFIGVQQLVEIEQMQAVGVVTANNEILVWDMFSMKQLLRIKTTQHSHLITFVNFKTYGLLLTQGYDEEIQVFSLNDQCNDSAHLGSLLGHQSIVTAIQCIENTPMAISADDRGNIKIWDIRDFKCLQSLHLEMKQPIKCMHILPDSIAVVSSRLTCIQFEGENNIQDVLTKKSNSKSSLLKSSKGILYDFGSASNLKNLVGGNGSSQKSKTQTINNIPVSLEYDSKKMELAICSRIEVKYVNMRTGRLNRITSGISTSADDEITSCRTFQQGKKFLAGNQKGKISIYRSRDGELLGNDCQQHSDEVTVIRMDYLNRLVISGSIDGNIYISREMPPPKQSGFSKLREIYLGKPIKNLEVSVCHNTIAAISTTREIFLINYEFAKLFAVFTLPLNEEEPTTIEFVHTYSVMLLGTSLGRILVIKFKMTDENIDLNLLAVVNTNGVSIATFEQQLTLVEQIKTQQRNAQTTNGSNIDDTNTFGLTSPTTIVDNSRKRGSKLLDNLQKALTVRQTPPVPIIPAVAVETKSKVSVQEIIQQCFGLIEQQPSRTLFDIQAKMLLVGCRSGLIQVFDLQKVFDRLNQVPASRDKPNYNPFRSTKEDSTKILISVTRFRLSLGRIHKESPADLSSVPQKDRQLDRWSISGNNESAPLAPLKTLDKFARYLSSCVLTTQESAESVIDIHDPKETLKAHKEAVHSMKFVDLGTDHIVTSSIDQYLKIWSYPDFKMQCNLNTEHPLPILWDITIDNSKIKRKKLLYVLTSMKLMRQKYRKTISLVEEKKYAFSEVFSDFYNGRLMQGQGIPKELQARAESAENPEENEEQEEDIVENWTYEDKKPTEIQTMKDEYCPKDLVYEKIKAFYQDELKGPSLRHLNELKKLSDSQNNQKISKELNEPNVEEMQAKQKLERFEERANQMKKLMDFFEPNYRDKLRKIAPVSELCARYPAISTLNSKMESIGLSIESPTKQRLPTNKFQRQMTTIFKKTQSFIQQPLNPQLTAAAAVTTVTPIQQTQKLLKNNQSENILKRISDLSVTAQPQTTATSPKNDMNNRSSYRGSMGMINDKNQETKSFFGYASEKNLILNNQSTDFNESNLQTSTRAHAGQLRNMENKRFASIMRSMDLKLKQSRGFAMRTIRQNDEGVETKHRQIQNYSLLSGSYSTTTPTPKNLGGVAMPPLLHTSHKVVRTDYDDEHSFEGNFSLRTKQTHRRTPAGNSLQQQQLQYSLQKTGSTFFKTEPDSQSVFSKTTSNYDQSPNHKLSKSNFHHF